jgi:hypothetical protein
VTMQFFVRGYWGEKGEKGDSLTCVDLLVLRLVENRADQAVPILSPLEEAISGSAGRLHSLAAEGGGEADR